MHISRTSKRCPYCKKYFTSTWHVNRHIKNNHPPQFACPVEDCDYTFIMNYEYKKHYICNHTTEPSFFCPTCDKGFKLMGHCMTHIRRESCAKKKNK